MSNIELRKKMIGVLKELNKLDDASEKFSQVDLRSLTPSQAQKRSTDANWRGMERAKLEHRLHVLCVDIGAADMRHPDHYAESTLSPSSFHTYRWIKEKPKALQCVRAAS